MCDLETLDTIPSAAIISIGIVKFDPFIVQNSFKKNPYHYQVVDKASCIQAGMTVDDETIRWWQRQSGYAQRILEPKYASPPIENVIDIMTALRAMSHFITTNAEHKDIYIWSNASTFDITILSDAYRRHGLQPPWKYTGESCYRTINTITKLLGIKVDKNFQGTKHHSGHDAINQCLFMQRMLQALFIRTEK